MVTKISLQYPHNITVIGKTTMKDISDERMEALTIAAFITWLNRNYNSIESNNLGISLLCQSKEEWEKENETYHKLEMPYQEYVDMIELFAGQTIEVIVGR